MKLLLSPVTTSTSSPPPQQSLHLHSKRKHRSRRHTVNSFVLAKQQSQFEITTTYRMLLLPLPSIPAHRIDHSVIDSSVDFGNIPSPSIDTTIYPYTISYIINNNIQYNQHIDHCGL